MSDFDADVADFIGNNSLRPTGDAPEPSMFSGGLKELGKGIELGGAKTGRAGQLALAVPAIIADKISGNDLSNDESFTKAYFDFTEPTIQSAVDYWQPDTVTSGKGAQVLNGLGSMVLPLAMGRGNPSFLMAAETGNTAAHAIQEGASSEAAINMGMLDATSIAFGFKMPFLGKNLFQKIGWGVGGNMALGAATRGAQNDVAEKDGVESLAKMYQPFDPTAMTVDAITGGAFGTLAHIAQPKPSEVDAALVVNNNEAANRTPTGYPIDDASRIATREIKTTLLEQILGGKPLSVDPAKAASIRTTGQPDNLDAVEASRSLGQNLNVQPSNALSAMDLLVRKKLRYDSPDLNNYAAHVEQQMDLPPGILNALKNAGERSNSNQVSPKGAKGVMQFIGKTAKGYGLKDATDPVQSIDAAGRYVQDMLKRYDNNIDAVITEYNGGIKQAKRVQAGGLPTHPETIAYLARVKAYRGDEVKNETSHPTDSTPESAAIREDEPTLADSAAERPLSDADMRTNNLREWYGQDAEPTIMYHGTPREWSAWDSDQGNGLINLTDDIATARSYANTTDGRYINQDGVIYEPQADGSFLGRANDTALDAPAMRQMIDDGQVKPFETQGEVMPLYSNIKNPLDLTAGKAIGVLDNIKPTSVRGQEIISQAKGGKIIAKAGDNKIMRDEIIPKLKEQGYDGLRFNDKSGVTLSAFDASQIKSADKNTGGFSRDNPDIYDAGYTPKQLDTKSPQDASNTNRVESSVEDLGTLRQIADEYPDQSIEIDGEVMTVKEAAERLEQELNNAEAESKGFEAAAKCKLRIG